MITKNKLFYTLWSQKEHQIVNDIMRLLSKQQTYKSSLVFLENR